MSHMQLVQLGLALVLAVTVVVAQVALVLGVTRTTEVLSAIEVTTFGAEDNSVLATATLKSAKAATRELKTAIEVVGDCKRVWLRSEIESLAAACEA
jgi:hypothetical protein